MDKIPFVTRPANQDEIDELATKIVWREGKKGFYVSGDEFAKALADVTKGTYAGGKRPFDIFHTQDLGFPITRGVEVKSKQHNPEAGYLYVEFGNGTAKPWKFLKQEFGLTRRNANAAHELGRGYFAWKRNQWQSCRSEYQDLELSLSVFLVGQVYNGNCCVYTYPLVNFPDWRDLTWSFGGEDDTVLIAHNGNHKVFEWYMFDNGQAKFYPRTKDCLFVSSPFTMR